MPSTQLLRVIFSMRQHVWSSKGQLQAIGIEYTKELYIIVMFRIEILNFTNSLKHVLLCQIL